MLELPEAEVVRRDLDKEISSRKVKEVDASGPMVLFDGFSTRKAIAAKLVGNKINSVRRQGITLLFDLDTDETMLIDLSAGVVMRRNANKDALEDDTVLVVTFTQGGQVRMLAPADTENAMRIVATEALPDELPRPTGFDPIDEPIPWTQFGQTLRARTGQKLYDLLRDQSFVVGLGPVYIDEILHAALLRHDRVADGVTIQEIRRLYRAIVETMHNAVKYRGTSLPDDPFTDVFGNPGGFDSYLEVYGRAGERSRNGRGEVQKMKVSGNVHYYCDYQV